MRPSAAGGNSDKAFSLCLLTTAEEWQQLQPLQENPGLGQIYLGPLVAVGKWLEAGELQSFEALSNDLEWLSKQAVAHDQTIKSVAAKATALPFKLGSFFSSQQLLAQRIREKESLYLKKLRQLKGKQEWSVKLYANPSELKLPEGSESDAVKELRQQLQHATAGKAFLLRKKLDQSRQQQQAQQLQQQLDAFSHELRQHCIDWKSGGNLSQKITGKTAEMLLNCALLIDQAQQPGLQEWLMIKQRVWAQWNAELAVSGPWPPYHFTQL